MIKLTKETSAVITAATIAPAAINRVGEYFQTSIISLLKPYVAFHQWRVFLRHLRENALLALYL